MKSGLSKELAEFIGILLGDGSINIYPSNKYSTYYRVKITFHSGERDYINYVSKLISKLFGEFPILKKRKNEKATDLFIFKKSIVEYLLQLGLKNSPKWDRAIIPKKFMNKKLGKYVLRGYFDTDGSLVLTQNNGIIYPRLEMKISPSPMLNQFKKLACLFDFKYRSYDIGKGKVRIQINGLAETIKWNRMVGFSNPKHIKKFEYIINERN